MESPADELFFGGAAGGGKTDLLLGLSLTAHKRSIIYRREVKQFAAIVERSREILRGRGWRYNANDHVWRSPDQLRYVEFGGAQHEWDWEKHQGHPFDLICWDELPHFTRLQYRILNGWNRTAELGQRCRVVATGNPPTSPEGRWVVEEFAPWLDSQYANPARPGELRWYAVIDEKLAWVESGQEIFSDGERIKPRSRTFIPALVTDNPVYMATDYMTTLQALPEPMRSQFLYGDFDAGLEDDPWQVIPTAWVRAAQQRWNETPPGPMDSLGVDVARGGRDKTVLAPRHGNWFDRLKKYEGRETVDGPAVATLVVKTRKDDADVMVDVVGIGASVYDYLKECRWFQTLPVNNASSTAWRDKSGRLKFSNLRAASYWKLREDLDPDGPVKLALPPDNELLADLCAPHYKLQSSGIRVEPKEDIIERIGRSPDCGDAVVMANWQGMKPAVGQFRILGPRSPKEKGLRIVVCSDDELNELLLEQRCLLVRFCDPQGVMCSGYGPDRSGLRVNGAVGEVPANGLSNLLGHVTLVFADIQPADFQDRWGEPVPPWGLPPAELVMRPEHGKKLWALLLKKRDPAAEVFVFCGPGGGDRRAKSAALAVCDSLMLKREQVVWEPSRPDDKCGKEEKPGNGHVFSVVKQSRYLVVG